MKIGLLIIGDEILDGSREDINAHFVIKELKRKNQTLNMIVIIKDDEEAIGKSIKFLLENNDFVITSGGLGLTPDDVTLSAIAKAIHRKIINCEEAGRAVRNSLKRIRKRIREELSKEFSRCIEGAEIIENKVGVAPIEKITKDGKTIYILPGVPAEFSAMFKENVIKEIPAASQKREVQLRVDCRESDIVDILRKVEERFNTKTASYPPIKYGEMLTVKLTGNNVNEALSYLLKHLKERGINCEKNFS